MLWWTRISRVSSMSGSKMIGSLENTLGKNKTNSITTRVSTSFNVEVDVPAFKLNGHIVWGATAMMLSELKDLLKEVL